MSTKLDLYIIALKMYDLQILFIALLEIQLLTGDGQSVQVGLACWSWCVLQLQARVILHT